MDVTVGDPTVPGPSDPPYGPEVVFPSGLHIGLVPDAGLTRSYPDPGANPFGGLRAPHYARVGYFLPLDRIPGAAAVTANFRLSEYVNPTLRWGGSRAYVDPEIAQHVQAIRSGLGRPLLLSSAFRSPAHNRDVGGATFSRHVYGDAVDIDVDQSRADGETRAQEVYNEALDVGADFVQPLSETSVDVGGSRRVSWVHVDDRGF